MVKAFSPRRYGVTEKIAGISPDAWIVGKQPT
jgi:hypothetical protein